MNKKGHSTYKLTYHIIMVCKYRLKLLQNEVAKYAMTTMQDIAAAYDFKIVEQNVDSDHIHLLVESEPRVSPLSIIRVLKQISTVRLWEQFPQLHKQLWNEKTFWSDGYYVSTTGSMNTEVVQKYIANQGNENCFEMVNSQKIRLVPNKEQQTAMNCMFGEARSYYNHLVASGKDKTTPLNNKEWAESREWEVKIFPQALQQCGRQYKKALQNTFKSGFGFPKFRNKHGNQSFKNCMPSQTIDGKHYLITHVGRVKMKQQLRFDDVHLTNYTVSREGQEYYIAFQFEMVVDTPLCKQGKSTGIDMGLIDFVTTSDGVQIHNPKWDKEIQRIKREQIKLSRKVKKSNNFNKNKIRLQIAHKRLTNKRIDFQQQLSTRLIGENQAIYLEDLSVAGMMKNRKVSHSFQETGMSRFVGMIQYKGWRDGTFVSKVSRWYPSSKLCSCCGQKNTALRLNEREWVCSGCNTHHLRDVNAAINILNEGQKNRWIVGDSLLSTPTVLKDCGNVAGSCSCGTIAA